MKGRSFHLIIIILIGLMQCKMEVSEEIPGELHFLKEKEEKVKNFNLDFKDLQTLNNDESLDAGLAFDEIVTKKGYPLASYYVKTKDGYILKLYRIPGPKGSLLQHQAKNPSRGVVLLQHGLLDSSDSWVSNFESKSLPFILANKGYDVWLGNNRGNKYSRSHMTLNPDEDKAFWAFSLHEMGTLDLPAMIDFILNETGRKKISYIGHSQGTAQLFAALTLDNEYFSQRLNGFFAFGPVTNLQSIGSTFLKIVADTRIDILLGTLGLFNDFLPTSKALTAFENFTCGRIHILCEGILRLIADSNPFDDDQTRFIVFIDHYPSGASLQTIHHFADNIRSNRFGPLDHNLPAYALENIKDLPIHLYVGSDDLLATVADNRILKDILDKSGILKFYKEYKNTGHLSFFLSIENEHVNDMLPVLDEINSKDD